MGVSPKLTCRQGGVSEVSGITDASDWSAAPCGLTAEDFEAYKPGVEAHKKAMSEKLKLAARRKKEFVEGQGMVEGRDFVVGKVTGKLLSNDRLSEVRERVWGRIAAYLLDHP